MNKKNTKIISIASVSGGGKTTITNLVKDQLDNAYALFFDDYEFKNSPDSIIQWVKAGPDYNLWDLDPLVKDIRLLLKKEQSPTYIILDYPFAYMNKQLSEYINFSIYIDTPLDVALGRRILRDYNDNDPVYRLKNDIKYYLSNGRVAYLEMLKTIKSNSDIVIDGTLSSETIAIQIIAAI